MVATALTLMPAPDSSDGASVTAVASGRPFDGGRNSNLGGSKTCGAGIGARSGLGSSGKASHSASGFGSSPTASATGGIAMANIDAASPIRTHLHPNADRSVIP